MTMSAEDDNFNKYPPNPTFENPSEYVAPTSRMYLVASAVASLFFTASCVIRGVESEQILPAKCTLSLASLTTGILYMTITKLYSYYKVKGTGLPVATVLPWYQNGQFVSGILKVLMLRGALEFAGSLLYLYSLKIALEQDINQGICSSCVTMAGIMITIMSYLAYNEKLNAPQIVGMALVLLAVVFMGAFQSADQIIINDQGQAITVTDDMSQSTAILLIILYGSLAALAFSFEALLIRWGTTRGVPGDVGGYMTLFFDGVYGAIVLIFLCLFGVGWQQLDSSQIWLILGGGMCTSAAIVLVNYSVANGIAGISFSLANSFPAWHSMFNYFVFSQLLSVGQVVGIILAVGGGIILSLSQQLDCCSKQVDKSVQEDQKQDDSENQNHLD